MQVNEAMSNDVRQHPGVELFYDAKLDLAAMR